MMTEDSLYRFSASESDSSTGKQRKKRKWDQPDEALVSSGILPIGTGFLTGTALSAVTSLSAASLAIPSFGATPMTIVHAPLQQHASAIVQKLLQPKIQDELIAREIVINDADSSVRYKLTKRQTQEEIQKNTGAVVITRGRYRPPNAPSDGDRPLYLHISAASHLETTAERIKAVDLAAAMVEEMLKQATASNIDKTDHVFSTCVSLGFEADPSLDIASRTRGPNDQYVNHIMNETGATVLLRGRGSQRTQSSQNDESQQPLHLLLSSNDCKKLEHAKLLAENLFDSISADCGASRVSSCKVYGAVPPPPQLLDGVHSLVNGSKPHDSDISCPTVSPSFSNVTSHTVLSQSVPPLNPRVPLVNTAYGPLALTNSTSYSGYGGIYPQATPLQQVALALKQSSSPVTATIAPLTGATKHTEDFAKPTVEKQHKRRKFQELHSGAMRTEIPHQNIVQESETFLPADLPPSDAAREISVNQEPARLIRQPFKGMPPPPRRLTAPSPPPPPKFNSSTRISNTVRNQQSEPKAIPDTLIKLMEYGDEDDWETPGLKHFEAL